MVDCSRKAFVDFCLRRELQHVPQLEFILYGNSFKFLADFSEARFHEWVTAIFDKEAAERRR